MSRTPNIGLNTPDFNSSPWHTEVNENFKNIDALFINLLGITNIHGVYRNSTEVVEDDRYFDPTSYVYFRALQSFVTMPYPTTFLEERLAHPERWEAVSTFGVGTAGLRNVGTGPTNIRDNAMMDVFLEALTLQYGQLEESLGTMATRNAGTAGAEFRTNTQNDGHFARLSQNLADLPNKATARTQLSVAEQQASAYDATNGRALLVGAFGLGGAPLLFNGNLNDLSGTQFVYAGTNAGNKPVSSNGWVLHLEEAVAGFSAQTFWAATATRMYFRRKASGVWQPWFEIWNANTRRSDVEDNALFVPQTRSVATGIGLNGGGDLSANRSLSIDRATLAGAQAHTDHETVMTPLRTWQSIVAQISKFGEVGTLALASVTNGGADTEFGATLAGSNLIPAGVVGNGLHDAHDNLIAYSGGGSLSGTWRCLGFRRQTNNLSQWYTRSMTLWVRIS